MDKRERKIKQSAWSEDDIDELAQITPEDIKAAREAASPALRKMLDATEKEDRR